MTTIPQVLWRRLETSPQDVACHYVDAQGKSTSLTISQLMKRALDFAHYFRSQGKSGELVGICLYHSVDLHAAFLGAMWSGNIPTMLAPPSPRMEKQKYANSFKRMVEIMKPLYLVVDRETDQRLRKYDFDEHVLARVLGAHEIPKQDAWIDPVTVDPERVALVQHSSGTTGLQKGVALSHQALLRHNEVYCRRLGIHSGDTIVSWLPLYHDMGFVACFLLPLLRGVPFVEISPFDWVLHPQYLFEKIHEHQGTFVWLPNFAFSFLAKSINPADLDPSLRLSSIRAWINSSEAVYASTFQAFLERFRGIGVREDQFTILYGMAENVFGITQSLPDQYRTIRVQRKTFREEQKAELSSDKDALPFVSCGRVLESTKLKVIDAQGKDLPDGQEGEFAIQGEHCFSGYFEREDLTQETWTADGWYRTGDLGFRFEGEVFVTGRKKDLIIIQGKNLYPTDIEEVVGQIQGIKEGRVSAFGLADEVNGTEKLVVVAEMEKASASSAAKLKMAVRKAVAEHADCTVSDIRIVEKQWLVKTTSGKMARSDNRNKYLTHFLSEKDA